MDLKSRLRSRELLTLMSLLGESYSIVREAIRIPQLLHLSSHMTRMNTLRRRDFQVLILMREKSIQTTNSPKNQIKSQAETLASPESL